MYDCTRCGKFFGSHSAVKMHLRRRHFGKSVCDKCGKEIFRNQMTAHESQEHPFTEHLPAMFRPPPSKAQQIMRPTTVAEEASFWEVAGARLPRFVASGTWVCCRVCHKTLGSVHGREQHERESHRFTPQIKGSLALKLSPWNFLEHLSPSNLEYFVRHQLTSQYSGTYECHQEVNVLVDFLLEDLALRVSHVVRGGSYGRDTCLEGHSDLDLAMFVEGFPPLGNSINTRLPKLISDLKQQIQASQLSTRVLISDVTMHSLRFQYKCHKDEHIHHVDLMPCHDWLGEAPTLADKHEIYEMIGNCKNSLEIQLLNASLLQLQVDFVRSKPSNVRKLIRLVKEWKRTAFGQAEKINRFKRSPNSYTMELITIHAWECHGSPVKFKLRTGLASVLKILVDYENLCAYWAGNYTENCHFLQRTLKGPLPVVVDPANPLNNVCESSNTWDELAYVASRSLMKPLFKGLNLNTQSWV